jgi:hypothetical protein
MHVNAGPVTGQTSMFLDVEGLMTPWGRNLRSS